MVRKVLLEVQEENLTKTFTRFCADLLLGKKLDALLVPLELPGKANVVPTLVTDSEKCDAARLFAPVMPVNTARVVSEMTKVTPSSKKIGVVLRNCEIRALLELVKLRQAFLENITIIGIDCLGTYTVNDYAGMVARGEVPEETVLNRFIKSDLKKHVGITVLTEGGEEVLEGMDISEDADIEKREEKLKEVFAQQANKREQFFKENASRFQGVEQLMSVLSPCIRCYNCRTVCPACYCKECFFDSPTFEMESDRYLGWAQSKGAVRMPSNTLFYHLTRMAHMATSCIGCGLCSEACPNDIPVAEIFQLAAAEVQKDLNYIPGRSLDEELPLSSFREDELREAED